MRRVLRREDDKVTIEVETPWLTEAEAAIYCACSRTTFRRRFAGTPRAGQPRSWLYHVDILDKRIADMAATAACIPQNYHRNFKDLTITDPVTGKVYRAKPAETHPNNEG